LARVVISLTEHSHQDTSEWAADAARTAPAVFEPTVSGRRPPSPTGLLPLRENLRRWLGGLADRARIAASGRIACGGPILWIRTEPAITGWPTSRSLRGFRLEIR